MKHQKKITRLFLYALALVSILFISWQTRPLVVNFINDYPRNREPGWSENAQGLANDDNNWFISQQKKIWRIPVTRDLNNGASGQNYRTAEIPKFLRDKGFNHFGDPDCFEGKLFVPLEMDDKTKPQKIIIFRSSDLKYLGSADLITAGQLAAKQTNASWCAIDPMTKILWTSNYDNIDQLLGYTWNIDNKSEQLILKHIHTKNLNRSVKNVQGGAFSGHSGLFYLVSHKAEGGLYVWDWRRNQFLGNTRIRYKPNDSEELEGLTVWNIKSGNAPNVSGQVHVVMIENDWLSADNIWIKHFDVNQER